MNDVDERVTAQIVRTENGETYQEYRVDGVSYSSADALESALESS